MSDARQEYQKIINREVKEIETRIDELIKYSEKNSHMFIHRLVKKKLLGLAEDIQIFKDEV